MKAFLLAGGFGTRLKPITDHTPKCLVEIAGKPLLQYWLEALHALGCTQIYINTHYLSEQVNQFIENSPFAEQVTLIHEPALLGTMGSIRHNRDKFDSEATLIAHADNFCLTDWLGFKSAFDNRPVHCELTMMLFETPTPWSCGIVKHNENNILTDYIEKPEAAKAQPEKYGNLANAAVFIASSTALDDICSMPADCDDLCRDYLPLQIGKANTFVNDEVHIDIGTPETYALANELMKAKALKNQQGSSD